MKKFITHMLYALVAYVLIYAIIISYMHVTASATRDYCEQLAEGMTLQALQDLADQQHLKTELMLFPENKGKILVVKKEPDSKAACKVFLAEGALKKKQFIQHIF